jgi:lipopolysaccharide export system permease protein
MGLWHLVKPLVKFAWPLWLVILLLQLIAWPWANQQMNILRSQYEQRDDLQRVQPGTFQESADGRRVFYIGIDESTPDQGRQVFIQAQTNNGLSLMSAATGKIVTKENGSHLLITQGQRVDHLRRDGSTRTIEFESNMSLVHTNQGKTQKYKADQQPSLDLWHQGSPVAMAELGWRVGMALMAFNFVFLGLAAVQFHPRGGKGAGLAFAVATAVVYFNLLNIGKGWVSVSAISPWAWLLILHGSVFIWSVLWLSYRHNNGIARNRFFVSHAT